MPRLGVALINAELNYSLQVLCSVWVCYPLYQQRHVFYVASVSRVVSNLMPNQGRTGGGGTMQQVGSNLCLEKVICSFPNCSTPAANSHLLVLFFTEHQRQLSVVQVQLLFFALSQ